jgi:hypothetical protein
VANVGWLTEHIRDAENMNFLNPKVDPTRFINGVPMGH